MQRTIIIEDELHAQKLLTQHIADYCPSLKLIGLATNIDEGVKIINELKPDLLFLDSELGSDYSFEILDKVLYRDFKIICTSAHNQYAIKAFQYEAIDYIMKPYVPKDVVAAVEKVNRANQLETSFQQFSKMSTYKTFRNKRVSIPTREGISLISLHEIKRIKAERSYCYIYLVNKTKFLVTKSLGEMQKLLPASMFFRTHTSHLINLDYIKQYVKEDGGFVIMDDDEQIPLARRRKSVFLDLL